MNLVFYILQLLSPEPFSETSQKASVESLQSVYESYHSEQYLIRYYEKETSCMAKALYWEGRGESSKGLKLIAQVIENRVRSEGFPNTVCNVVSQKVAGQYQFSYHYNGKLKIRDIRSFNRVSNVAQHVMKRKENYTSAIYFKVCSQKSEFFNKLRFVTKEGSHCFYR